MGKWLRTLGWMAVVIGVIVGGLRATVLRWWWVPTDDAMLGASLAPSLFPGDLILMWHNTPKFGDLARCADPETPGRYIIGRVVGESGDKLEFRSDNVVVNGKQSVVEHSCSPDHVTISDPTSGADFNLRCSVESIINHKHMRGTNAGSAVMGDRHAEVAQGQFYLLSDNRVFPFDSRNYGGVPIETCRDVVFFRIMGRKGLSDVDTRLMVVQ